jgi:hypothetical protein
MKIYSWLRPAAAAAAALAVAGCGTSGGTQGGPARPPAAGRQAAAPAGQIGGTFRLAGLTSAEALEVMASKTLADPAPAGRAAGPATGMRYFAVTLRLAASTMSGFTLSPWQDASVRAAGHGTYQARRAKVRGCHAFAALVTLAPGREKSGCVVFQVPAGATVTQVQFSLEPGRSGYQARWSVAAIKSGRGTAPS